MVVVLVSVAVLLVFLFSSFFGHVQANFDVRDMHQLARLGDAQLSSDGHYAVYTVRQWNMAKDEKSINVDILDLTTLEIRHLTTPVLGQTDDSPTLAPDNSVVVFIRDGQLWQVSVSDPSAQPVQLSAFPDFLEVGNLRWSPAGNYLLFTIEVFESCPDSDLGCTSVLNKEKIDYGPNGYYEYSKLFVRHWAVYNIEGKHSHVFILPIKKSGSSTWAPTHSPIDLMFSLNAASPIPPFGGPEEITISPDDTRVSYCVKDMSSSSAAWRTDWKVYFVEIDVSSGTWAVSKNSMISHTDARTQDPTFGLDSKTLVYSSATLPRIESDRLFVVVRNLDTGKETFPVKTWDASVDGTKVWYVAPASGRQYLLVSTYVGMNHGAWAISLDDDGVNHLLDMDGMVGDITIINNSTKIFFSLNTILAPTEFFVADLVEVHNALQAVNVKQVTNYNTAALKKFEWEPAVPFSYPSGKYTVHGLIMKPVGYQEGTTYPVAHLIHGGPEGVWDSSWSTRWNPALWSAHGYAVVMINPCGSEGYGNNFTACVRGNWGAQPYDDLMNGLDYVFKQYPWMDADRLTACGASYGGYMINWLNTHTKRYKALVCHDGVWDTESFYYSTDELWFPEAEFGGGQPEFANPAGYAKYNPRLSATDAVTPQLTFHGGIDFRIPIAQGLGAFTNLQRRGIASKLIVFPEECHFVLREMNSILWYDSVLAWLDEYTGGS